MKSRIISRNKWAGIVLSSIACLTFGLMPNRPSQARPPQGAADPSPKSKDGLRAEVVRIGVELEVLQLEQDIDRAAILECSKVTRDYGLLFGDQPKEKGDNPIPNEKQVLGGLMNEFMGGDPGAIYKAEMVRARNSYTKRAATLVSKRIDFADVERRYRDAR